MGARGRRPREICRKNSRFWSPKCLGESPAGLNGAPRDSKNHDCVEILRGRRARAKMGEAPTEAWARRPRIWATACSQKSKRRAYHFVGLITCTTSTIQQALDARSGARIILSVANDRFHVFIFLTSQEKVPFFEHHHDGNLFPLWRRERSFNNHTGSRTLILIWYNHHIAENVLITIIIPIRRHVIRDASKKRLRQYGGPKPAQCGCCWPRYQL